MTRATLRWMSAVALTILVAGQALAADREGARQLLRSGLTSMKANDFSAAAADFEKSIALAPTPDSLLNLAACYRSLQRYGEALDLLKRLRLEFGDKLKPDNKSASERLEAEVQSLVATLVLSVEPPSAEVSIDGRVSLASAATESYLLAPGDHTIEASLAGFRPLTRAVRLAAGTQVSERLVLEPAPGTLLVRSDPRGATVLIDNQERALTPTEPAIELAPGPHRMVLRMNGRIPIEQNVEIRSGEQQSLELTLLPLPPPLPPLVSTPAVSDHPPPPDRTWKTVGQISAVGAVLASGGAIVLWRGVAEGHFRKMKEYDRNYLATGNPYDEHNRRVALHNAQMAGYVAIGLGIGAGLLAATAIAAFVADAHGDGARETGARPSVTLSATGIRLGF